MITYTPIKRTKRSHVFYMAERYITLFFIAQHEVYARNKYAQTKGKLLNNLK